MQTWLKDVVADKLKPLADMSAATDLQGLARGIAFRLKENFGVLKREAVADEINALDQAARADLRKYGLRFGAFNIFFPLLLKPASADLAATLWLLKNPVPAGSDGAAVTPVLPRPGLTSVAADPATPDALYRANGFHVCGPRAVRLDILERLADLIRPLLAFRSKPDDTSAPPKGATGDGGFRATDDMMSILGCSADELGNVLKALGFRLDRRPIVVAAEAPKPAVADPIDGGDGASAAEIADAVGPAAVAEAPAAEAVVAVAPVSEAALAEVVPVEAAPSDSAAEALKVDEKFEDIWRPRRHPRPERGRGHERGGQDRNQEQRRGGRDRRPAKDQSTPAVATEGAQAPATAPATGDAAGVPAERAPRPDQQGRRDNRDRRPQEGRDGAKPDHRRGGGQGKTSEGKPGDGKPGQGRPGGGPGRGDRPREGGRPDRGDRGDRGRRDDARRQTEVISAAPPKKAGVDPDSPFAALLALKANMDKRGDGPGSR